MDFTGGIILNSEMGKEFDAEELEKTLAELGVIEMQLAKTGSANALLVRSSHSLRLPYHSSLLIQFRSRAATASGFSVTNFSICFFTSESSL
jgi:preprotein translocase subunit SecF